MDEPAPDTDPVDAGPVEAGPIGAWLDAFAGTVAGDADADVPCGTCTGCCTSSQFIAIGPDEVDALRRIPAALRFPAPGRPKGHVLLGYDERGHCPMLVDGACSIYEDRPRTCRTYDCRVFPAAGLEPDEPTKAAILDRVRRWRFSHDRPDDEVRHDAVRAAARFLRCGARLAGRHGPVDPHPPGRRRRPDPRSLPGAGPDDRRPSPHRPRSRHGPCRRRRAPFSAPDAPSNFVGQSDRPVVLTYEVRSRAVTRQGAGERRRRRFR